MPGLIIGGIVVVLIIAIVLCYNSLVASRNKVKEEWSGIDVQLNRRFDLIPNLVETVKGYAKHEEETLTKLNSSLASNLRAVYAVAENYPELKANENFLQLQAELTNTEEKIAHSRLSYNEAVNNYNTKIDVIPTNIIAGMFNFKKAELFEVENEEARKNVKISF